MSKLQIRIQNFETGTVLELFSMDHRNMEAAELAELLRNHIVDNSIECNWRDSRPGEPDHPQRVELDEPIVTFDADQS